MTISIDNQNTLTTTGKYGCWKKWGTRTASTTSREMKTKSRVITGRGNLVAEENKLEIAEDPDDREEFDKD